MTDSDDRFSLIEMDPLPGEQPGCKRCGARVQLNAELVCRACHSRAPAATAAYAVADVVHDRHPRSELDAHFERMQPAIRAINAGMQNQPMSTVTIDADVRPAQASIAAALTAIAGESTANAAARPAPNMEPIAGYTARDGYIAAIRNGVPRATHEQYLMMLRTRFGMTSSDIAALDLPAPMALSDAPLGAGMAHVPAGHREGGAGIFDRPRAERRFVVGPVAEEQRAAADAAREVAATATQVSRGDMVAGAVAEGHHAIVAWEGTSGLTRGALVAQLGAIGRPDLAPKAPSAQAHAGAALNALTRDGLVVRVQRKGASSELAANEFAWTVGRVAHADAAIGAAYGSVVARFVLRGAELTATGPESVTQSVLADFGDRLQGEIFKSGDVTTWLGRVLRRTFDAVRFGAMGWLVPAVHVADARAVVGAVMASGFGVGWVDGLPVATSDQLRDGIVRGLRDEVRDTVHRIDTERTAAREARAAWDIKYERTGPAGRPPGDIGEGRAASHLRDLRAIAARVVGYGQMLGEERVAELKVTVREAMATLEGVIGEDYSGIRARFAGIWEEIEMDRRKNGGIL